jgi:uncharacterized DUF497 family protein
MRFAWDPERNRKNRAKHDLSFEEASERLRSGADYVEIFDEEHPEKEDRFIAIGPIKRGVIVVAYTEQGDEQVRILSARKATSGERKRFEGRLRGEHEERDS